MLDKLKSLFASKPKKAGPTAGPQLAMPLFDSVRPFDPAAVVEQWGRLFPKSGALRVADRKESVVEFDVGTRRMMAVHMPVAVPEAEVMAAVRASWMWQQPDAAVRAHRAHAIVAAPGPCDAVQAAWDVARLSAAILKSASGIALYWGNSRQVHLPDVVAQFAAEDDVPPVPLWVGITISGESKGGPFSAATHGLEALGHKEFEVLGTRMGIGELRTTLCDLALYVIQNGPVLQDGQTFGPSEEVIWKIRHRESRLVPGREAILLGIP